MFWIGLVIFLVGVAIADAIYANMNTNIDIANKKSEQDYYNSLTDVQKLEYNQRKRNEEEIYRQVLESHNKTNVK